MILGEPQIDRLGTAIVIKVPIPEKGIYQGIRINPGTDLSPVVSPCVVTWVSKLPAEEPTELVGVLYGIFDHVRDALDEAEQATMIFTYKALKSLRLAPGDRVAAPVGYPGSKETRDIRVATVVELDSIPDGRFFVRTITKRSA